MRFMFFETFIYPEAVVKTKIDPASLTDLTSVRRKIVPVTFTLDLHGVTKELTANVAVTLISDDEVIVSSEAPISIAATDFNLDLGIKKLEEAAKVVLIPSATVTFDLRFRRKAADGASVVAALTPETGSEAQGRALEIIRAEPASTALETKGDFDREACLGRFDILSKSDNIYFTSGSARIDARSGPLLSAVVDIVSRCPDMTVVVAGHTDSDGSDAMNQTLSERRAVSIANYLERNGVTAGRVVTAGYGESDPAFSNTAAEKWRNRRIEFSAR